MARASSQSVSTWLAVTTGTQCLGHVLDRGKLGWEAFDIDDNSIGTFDTQADAANAVEGAFVEAAP